MQCLSIAVAGVVLLLMVFWLVQFIHLMRMPDAAFPGRHDKVLWVVTFLLAGFVAPIAFWLSGISRRVHPVMDESPEPDEPSEEDEEPSGVEKADR